MLEQEGATQEAQVSDSAAGQISMGGNALGGNAETTVLAQLVLDEVPPGPLAWVTHRFELTEAPGGGLQVNIEIPLRNADRTGLDDQESAA